MSGFSSPRSGLRRRLFVGLVLLSFAFFPYEEVRVTLKQLLVEAYIGVSIFIILTLASVSLVEKLLDVRLGQLSQTKPNWQIPIASFLGALPGCGGAILVVSYYLKGQMHFGSVVAALTATMGDAAFLLLSKKPLVGLAIIATSFCTAVITGFFMQLFYPRQSVLWINKPTNAPTRSVSISATEQEHLHYHNEHESALIMPLRLVWWAIAIPGVCLGLFNVLFLEMAEQPLIANLTYYVGLAGACTTILFWISKAHHHDDPVHGCHHGSCTYKAIESDTAFITFWVVVSFITYNVIISTLGIDLTKLLLQSAKFYLPMVAILIGFIPGCGPQIIVATLYVQGIIPLSSQLGNAISTDGDALFPAIAMAPRAALLATIYSAIPAIILAYGYLFLFE